jgi:hypothetical protein
MDGDGVDPRRLPTTCDPTPTCVLTFDPSMMRLVSGDLDLDIDIDIDIDIFGHRDRTSFLLV